MSPSFVSLFILIFVSFWGRSEQGDTRQRPVQIVLETALQWGRSQKPKLKSSVRGSLQYGTFGKSGAFDTRPTMPGTVGEEAGDALLSEDNGVRINMAGAGTNPETRTTTSCAQYLRPAINFCYEWRVSVSLFVLLVYWAVGVAVFCSLEGWSLLDATYYLCVTFTTVGYGDIVPNTSGGKVAGIFFIYMGLIALGTLLAETFESALDTHEDVVLEQVQIFSKAAHQTSGNTAPLERARSRRLFKSRLRDLIIGRGAREVSDGVIRLTVLFACIYLLGVLWTTLYGGLSVIDAFWFTTVTISTVGYGDIDGSKLKDPRVEKLWSILFVIGGVFSLGAIVGTAIDLWYEAFQRETLVNRLNLKLSKEEFNTFVKQADVDGDGRLDMAEFTFVCLKNLGLLSGNADAATLLAIKEEFVECDTGKSGYIELSDLTSMTKAQLFSGTSDAKIPVLHRRRSSFAVELDPRFVDKLRMSVRQRRGGATVSVDSKGLKMHTQRETEIDEKEPAA